MSGDPEFEDTSNHPTTASTASSFHQFRHFA
jgi:hypothetical protein